MSSASTSIIERFRLRILSTDRVAKVAVMVLADLFFLPFCFMIATLLRAGNTGTPVNHGMLLYMSVAVITVLVFGMAGLYTAIVRFIDQRLLAATGLGLVSACLFF
jgi:FlaA1/EpsC-like NDP-sugar epimerase